jgi:ribosome biogenesis GTPase
MTYTFIPGPGLTLSAFGWTPAQAAAFKAAHPPALEPGRILAASRGLALVRTETGETWATPSGRLRQRLQAEELVLCAGDWLALEPQPGGGRALIHELLPRGPHLARLEAGPGGRPQVLAANLDVVFLVMGLDRNYNPGRMERLLALAWSGGVRPVILLTKRDLNPQAEALKDLMGQFRTEANDHRPNVTPLRASARLDPANATLAPVHELREFVRF